jgi:hypothetical protein
VRVLAAFAAFVVLAAGCGEAVSSDRDGSPSGVPARNSRLHRDDAGRFSLLVPKGWRVIDRLHPASPQFIATYHHDDPMFAAVLERMTATDSPFYLFAYERKPHDAFGATLNVLSVQVPDEHYKEFEQGTLHTVHELSTRGRPEITREEFAAGDVLKASYLHEVPTPQGCTCLSITQYVLHANGRAYLLTFSTAAGRRAEYARLFERAARSFRPL